jgi:hypothetical protein
MRKGFNGIRCGGKNSTNVPTFSTRHWPNTFFKISRSGNNVTPEHRTEEAPKELFWKSAQIMTPRYLGKS